MSAPPSEVTTPLPPRFRHLKFWSAVTLVALVAIVGLRAWWGHEAERRMTALIDAARARGEPILPADFNPPGPANTAGAAAVFDAAANAIKLTPAQDAWYEKFLGDSAGVFPQHLPLSPADVAMIRQLVWTYRPQLAQVRQARSIPLAQDDWGVRIATPAYATLLRTLNPARSLSDLLAQRALYEHTIGNDAEAVECALDLLRHHASVERTCDCAVVHLFGASRSINASETILQIAPSLDVAGAASRPSPPTTRPASREQVRTLLNALRDESALFDGARRARLGERMMVLDIGTSMATMLRPPWLAWLFRPMYTIDAVRGAGAVDAQYAPAAEQATYPAAVAAVPPRADLARLAPLHAISRTGSQSFIGWRNTFSAHYRALAARRAAAVALALRLYAVDHAGRLPQSLDALVPDYLDAVPVDPFAPDGRPLRYRVATTQATIYSVGLDGADNHADPTTTPASGPGSAPVARDLVYPLRPSEE
jgi:hypothetical protein